MFKDKDKEKSNKIYIAIIIDIYKKKRKIWHYMIYKQRNELSLEKFCG